MSTVAAPPIAIPGLNLNDTIGSLLLGGLVSAVLYGITSTQTAIYYQREHGDRLLVRLVVFVLWVLDSLDVCLICHILYWYLVIHYGNPLSLENPTWSIIMHVLVTSLTQTVVRGMFASRVYKLSEGNWIITLIIAIVTLVDLVTSTIITVKAFNTTFIGLKKLDALVYLEFVSGFTGDALVAVSLCYLLHRSRTGMAKTESVINVLMAYVVNTGLFTAMTASISVILFASRPNDFIYIAFYLQLSKLYVNAYLAMLNARDSLRQTMGRTTSVHLSGDSRPFTVHGGFSGGAAYSKSSTNHPFSQQNTSLEVVISTEVDTKTHSMESKDQGFATETV